MTALPGTVRELACLALRHPDGDEPRCSHTDEALVAELLRELLVARIAAGTVDLDEPADDAEGALVGVLLNLIVDPSEAEAEAHTLLGELTRAGWALVRVDR